MATMIDAQHVWVGDVIEHERHGRLRVDARRPIADAKQIPGQWLTWTREDGTVARDVLVRGPVELVSRRAFNLGRGDVVVDVMLAIPAAVLVRQVQSSLLDDRETLSMRPVDGTEGYERYGVPSPLDFPVVRTRESLPRGLVRVRRNLSLTQ